MAKPVFNNNQIIWQIAAADDGDPNYWSKGAISYSIPNVAPPSISGEHLGFVPMTAFMKQQTQQAFELWDDVIKSSLTEVAASEADITFALSSRTEGGPGAYTLPYLTDRGDHDLMSSADIWIHPGFSGGMNDASFSFGGWGFKTAIHEIGHALGLSHPGHYNGSADYARDAAYAQDTQQYSIMSYFKEGSDGSGVDYGGRSAQTPLLHDIMTIQALFGADMTTRTGDTTYGFNSNAGRAVFDFTVNKAPIVCIWDAAGNDTLHLGGSTFNQTIDLREGAFSSVMGLGSNLSIAYGCKVENAVGGAAADTVIGNALGNALYGGAGGDSLYGLGGNDGLVGGAGADVFWFVNAGRGSSGFDLIADFQVGVDRVHLDDTFIGTSAATLAAQIKTEGHGWAYLELSASDGVVFQNVSEAALKQSLGSFGFF